MSDVIVRMEGISKAFAGIKALDNVRIELHKGEVHALMGENGAGKSTLMKIMTGVYSKDEGSMHLLNEETGQMEEVEMKSPLMAQKAGLSMVFQELNLLENMNIAENIFIGREPVGRSRLLDRDTLNKKAKAELLKVNLDVDPGTPVSQLSCGQMQCVESQRRCHFRPES